MLSRCSVMILGTARGGASGMSLCSVSHNDYPRFSPIAPPRSPTLQPTDARLHPQSRPMIDRRGDSTNQYFALKPGQACTIPCSNVWQIFAKTASSTGNPPPPGPSRWCDDWPAGTLADQSSPRRDEPGGGGWASCAIV